MINNDFFKSEVNFFIGIVEDRNDPEKLGRVRVRCFGIHTDDKTQIPTVGLPWAIVMLPTTSASISGIGESVGLLNGSMVVGFFLDGKNCQNPIVIGSVYAKRIESANPDKGFFDPSGKYPTYTNESDLSGLARSSYPYNHVFVTESGHSFQFDNSEGSERIVLTHRTGNGLSFLPDGSFDTGCQNYNASIKGEETRSVLGNSSEGIEGHKTIVANGNITLMSDGDIILLADRIHLNSNVFGISIPIMNEQPVSYPQNLLTIADSDGSYAAEHPDNPTNPEQKDSGEEGTVCVLESGENPYIIASQALNDDWNEQYPNGRNQNIKLAWDEIGYNGNQYADNTAWCAVFLGATLKRSGQKYIKTAFAKNYMDYGTEVEGSTMTEKLQNAQQGDVLVFDRNGVGGHVGFFTGEFSTSTGKFGCLGGNQGNTLKVSYFNVNATGMRLLTVRRAVPCTNYTALNTENLGDCAVPTVINRKDDFQAMVLNCYHEARGEPDLGIAAVAHSVINRLNSGDPYFTSQGTLANLVYQKNQYSWTIGFRDTIPSETQSYLRCCGIVKQVLSGEIPDPTSNSPFYYAQGTRTDSSFKKLFRQDVEFVTQIGRHRFFKYG